MGTKFGHVVVITYGQEGYTLLCFDAEQRPIGSLKVGPVKAVPMIFFQLIDQGYSVMRDEEKGKNVVLAFSPELHQDTIKRYTLVEKGNLNG